MELGTSLSNTAGLAGFDPTVGGRVRRFWNGFTFPLRAVRFMLRNPDLLPLLALPALVASLLLAAALWFAVGHVPALLNLIWARPGGEGWTHGLAMTGWYALMVLLAVALASLCLVVVYFLAEILATPFNDYLSEKVEERVTGVASPPLTLRVFARDTAVSIAHSLLNLLFYLLVMIPLLMLNLIPVVGGVLFSVCGPVATAYFLARDMLDGPLTRRRLSYSQKITLVNRHPALMMGFGSANALLLWVPGVNILCLPLAVVAGALLYCHLDHHGYVAPGIPMAS